MLMQKIRNAFAPPHKPVNVESRREQAMRLIVAQRSHGNIRLQKGKYYTDKDLDEQYEYIKGKRFSDA